MARPNPQGGFIIAAGEVGAFSVCPQAWHLAWNQKVSMTVTDNINSALGQRLHRDWSEFLEESLKLGNWIRYLAVLVCLTLVVFMVIGSSHVPLHEMFQLSLSNRGLQAIVLVGISFWLIKIFGKEAQRRHSASGFLQSEVALAIDGSQLLPEREYISLSQGLAGKPDAIIREGEYIVPVERKPLAKKLRDRYVAQLLIYMRLVEEFEKVRPPHGYLLIGPSCRRIKIINSDSKQRWVDKMLKDMRAVLNGTQPNPEPHPIKCAKCDVRDRCHARGDQGAYQ